MDGLKMNILNSFLNIKIASWNCNGFKSSIDYVNQLMSAHHVTFICEHWLRQHEFSTISTAGFTYKFEEYETDRICALNIIKNGCIILTAFGVYLPYDDHTSENWIIIWG